MRRLEIELVMECQTVRAHQTTELTKRFQCGAAWRTRFCWESITLLRGIVPFVSPRHQRPRRHFCSAHNAHVPARPDHLTS